MRHRMTSTFHSKAEPVAERATLTSTVRLLWPYIWPASRADLKVRVGLAFALMVLSKLVTIAIPYSFKWVTDSLAFQSHAAAPPLERTVMSAVSLTVVYGVLRILMAFTQQGRDALFASVAMNAVRKLAIEVRHCQNWASRSCRYRYDTGHPVGHRDDNRPSGRKETRARPRRHPSTC